MVCPNPTHDPFLSLHQRTMRTLQSSGEGETKEGGKQQEGKERLIVGTQRVIKKKNETLALADHNDNQHIPDDQFYSHMHFSLTCDGVICGGFNAASFLTVNFGSRKYQTVVRVPLLDQRCSKPERISGIATHRWLSIMTTVPVPRVLSVWEDWVWMERVPGDTLESVWGRLRTEEKESIIRQVAGIHVHLTHLPALTPFGTIRTIRPAGLQKGVTYGPLFQPDGTAWLKECSCFKQLFSYAAESIISKRIHSDDDKLRDTIDNLLWVQFNIDRLLDGGDLRPTLNHIDLSTKNIMVDGCKITAILDWDGAEILPGGMVHNYPPWIIDTYGKEEDEVLESQKLCRAYEDEMERLGCKYIADQLKREYDYSLDGDSWTLVFKVFQMMRYEDTMDYKDYFGRSFDEDLCTIIKRAKVSFGV